MNKLEKPLVVWDGDCGFCRRYVVRWRELAGDRVDWAPYQEAHERFPEIPLEQFQSSVHLFEVDGSVHRGAEAVLRVLAHADRPSWLWAYRHIPGFAPVAEFSYGQIASHRRFASRMVKLFVGPDPAPPHYRVSREAFLALLAVCFLVAFASLYVQLDGLIGSKGILPAADFLSVVRERLGSEGHYRVPSIFWLGAGDGALHLASIAGIVMSLLLFLGVAPRILLFLLWADYLSFMTTGGIFLGYQWDALLLETGFLAIFYAPRRLLPGWLGHHKGSEPSTGGLWLMRWLLFRLMFLSGMVKLLSKDPTWRNFTALDYHYWTQPLPTWTAYWASLLPSWFQKSSTVAMFVIELAAPFSMFGPRRIRLFGAAALIALQCLILGTGNYNFFNLLTIALCLTLIDDATLARLVPKRLRGPWFINEGTAPARSGLVRRISLVVVCVVLLLASTAEMLDRLGFERVPDWANDVLGDMAPFRTVNSYGLFAVMTTERHEISLEGSEDGKEWREYLFKWKPGPIDRKPEFVEPHQPRLDWQMWFAALGECRHNGWFLRFQQRLLEGAPAVRALLANDPFPDKPPRYLRSRLYDYRFADLAAHGRGDWWARTGPLGDYCPTLALEGGQLIQASP